MAQNAGPIAESAESNNVVLFRTAVTNCFKNIAESVSEEEFTNVFTSLKSNPSRAARLHKALMKELYESMRSDFDDVLAEGSLSSGLAKVAELAREASSRPDHIAWRPPGDVKEHMRSLDMAKITDESEKLEKEVQQMEAENERLMKQIIEKRTKVRMIEERVHRASRICTTIIPRAEKTLRELKSMEEAIMDIHNGSDVEEAIKYRPV